MTKQANDDVGLEKLPIHWRDIRNELLTGQGAWYKARRLLRLVLTARDADMMDFLINWQRTRGKDREEFYCPTWDIAEQLFIPPKSQPVIFRSLRKEKFISSDMKGRSAKRWITIHYDVIWNRINESIEPWMNRFLPGREIPPLVEGELEEHSKSAKTKKFGSSQLHPHQFLSEVTKTSGKEFSLGELKSMPYDKYLKTDHWQMVRKWALAIAAYKCQACSASDRQLNVHHNNYECRGEEGPSDVFVYCVPCHEKFHDILPSVPEEKFRVGD